MKRKQIFKSKAPIRSNTRKSSPWTSAPAVQGSSPFRMPATLVVPENGTVPNGLSEDITVLQKPLENVYLVSTSAMDPILKLDARSAVTPFPARVPKTGICRSEESRENGEISYAG